MRIGIDGSCLSNRRGFGRFARQLLEALAGQPTHHRFSVFLDRPSASHLAIPEHFNRVVVDVAEAPSRAASARGRRRWRDMIAMGRAVASARLDVMYFPATYTFFPIWNAGKVVVTMHDTLPLSHPELVFPTLRGRLAWWLKENFALWRADRIVTVSEASRSALLARTRCSVQKIRVITEGPDAVFQPRAHDPEGDTVLARLGIPTEARFLLYVGGLSPHKNLPRLVEAFAAAAPAAVKLVLTGDLNDVFLTHVPEIRAAITRHALEDRAILTGFVADKDLVFLYSRAYAVVLPSLLEGFGLPAVEAMACGTPVIASRAGSLPEVVGAAGVYFDPKDVGSIAEAIGGLLDDPVRRQRLAKVARERARLFSWEKSARALLDCFDELEHGAPVTARRAAWGRTRDRSPAGPVPSRESR